VGADAEDFASEVKVALLEDDCAILRKFEERSSLQSFLSIVIERLFYDHRTRAFGRWFASANAERLGPAAVLLEKLLRRDRRDIEQALPIVQVAHPELTRADVEALAEKLPERVSRPRPVALELASRDGLASSSSADDRALAREAGELADRAGIVIRNTLAAFALEDRMLIRMRFGTSMTIAAISRVMQLEQRPLYRRIEALLLLLRRALGDAGVDGSMVSDLVERTTTEMNFDLIDAENGAADQSNPTQETG
jgi:RNA polymerase sigma factor for flagellar operon FliA